MKTIKNKTTAIIAMSAFALGTFFYVQANNKKELLNTEVENLIDPLEKPVLVEQIHWFELIPTNKTAKNQQFFLTNSPMSGTPDLSNNTACAQADNEGDYCAVVLRFTGDLSNPIDTDLSGYSDLQDVLDNHPNAVEIVIDDFSIDEDEDGYSRKPL